MANFKIHKDYETSERAGAGGMYQIIELLLEDEDNNEVDVTDQVDVGIHFSSGNDEIYQYLAETFNISKEEINIEEV